MKRLDVNMTTGSVCCQEFPLADVLGGRGLVASLLSSEMEATADPLGPENLLVVCNGLLAGTSAPTAGRLSIGTKSPLTGTIKESNAGGTAGGSLAKLGYRCIVISGASPGPELQILVLDASGGRLEPAGDIAGLSTYAACERLREKYGEDNSIICVGPGAEFGYRFASAQVTDLSGHPARAAGRGGTGTVLASKGLKAIVIHSKGKEKAAYADATAFKQAVTEFAGRLKAHPLTGQVFPAFGTACLVGMVNEMGALPTRNFSEGRFEQAATLSAEHMAEQQGKRGGNMTHSCQAGCTIHCSNVYHDAAGQYLTSGLEYETIGLTGANLGIGDLDVVAAIDRACDEMGVDTMDTGVTIGLAMQAGVISFGDAEGVLGLLREMASGSPLGRELGQGPEPFAKGRGISRIPTVKGQGIAAYDPRGLKGTGVTYATSPMGADHTCGNSIGDMNMNPLTPVGQAALSAKLQTGVSMIDCLGLCLFSGAGLEGEEGMKGLCAMLSALYGGAWDEARAIGLGLEVLALERKFNRAAGFDPKDDDVPAFMRQEPLLPHNSLFDVPKEEMAACCSSC